MEDRYYSELFGLVYSDIVSIYKGILCFFGKHKFVEHPQSIGEVCYYCKCEGHIQNRKVMIEKAHYGLSPELKYYLDEKNWEEVVL